MVGGLAVGLPMYFIMQSQNAKGRRAAREAAAQAKKITDKSYEVAAVDLYIAGQNAAKEQLGIPIDAPLPGGDPVAIAMKYCGSLTERQAACAILSAIDDDFGMQGN